MTNTNSKQTKNNHCVYVNNHTVFEQFLELCKSGTSMEILAYAKQYGYERSFMTGHLVRRIASPIPVIPQSHPLYVACQAHNLKNIITLIELGADPNLPIPKWRWQPIRNCFSNNTEIWNILNDYPCWWLRTYSKHQQKVFQDDFKSCIKQKDYPVIIWHLLRGLYLDSPEILAEDSFNDFPRIMKDMVCRISIQYKDANVFLNWLQDHTSCQDTLASMESAASRKNNLMDIVLENIRLSIDLIDYDSLFDVIQSTIPLEEQVLLLKRLADRYDMTGNKETLYNIFMETLKNILYSLVS